MEWWYSPLTPDNEFPSACRRSLEYMALSFTSHVQSKAPSEVVMLAVMSLSSTLIVFFRELRAASLEPSTTSSSVLTYIRNNPQSALAQMADEKAQQAKLRYLSTRLLHTFARKSDMACEPTKLFAREMLAMQILNLTATECSKTSYINWYIVETLKSPPEEKGVIGNSDRAREAEEAMAQAVAEAAEMTKLLESQNAPVETNEITQDTSTAIEPRPKTTFASILQDSEDVFGFKPIVQEPNVEEPNNLPSPAPHESNPDVGEVSIQTLPPPSPSPSPSPLPPLSIPKSEPIVRTPSPEDPPPSDSLQNAKITLMDLSPGADSNKPIRQKSHLSYMITIEPSSRSIPGWISLKSFPDFEALHDILRRLANVGGIRSFPTELPDWKGRQYTEVAEDLEKYLRNALGTKQLADSEAMKRFFGKEMAEQQDKGKRKSGAGGWKPQFKAMGTGVKGMGSGVKDALSQSAEGSQKLIAAAWATAGIAKRGGSDDSRGASPVRKSKEDGVEGARASEEDTTFHSPLFRKSASFPKSMLDVQEGGLEQEESSNNLNGYAMLGEDDVSDSGSLSSTKTEDETSVGNVTENLDTEVSPAQVTSTTDVKGELPIPETAPKRSSRNPSPSRSPKEPERQLKTSHKLPELSADDAQQILDIAFSILSEFYGLSPRTWMIRKSLLNLLKSILLSNGRSYIDTLRIMIQEDLINKCLTSDDWLAGQIKAMTASVWPSTPWPPIDDEKYKVQARDLFLSKTLPDTMRGLMGGAATNQALELVFDALQEECVAKGIMVALMCDVIRALQV